PAGASKSTTAQEARAETTSFRRSVIRVLSVGDDLERRPVALGGVVRGVGGLQHHAVGAEAQTPRLAEPALEAHLVQADLAGERRDAPGAHETRAAPATLVARGLLAALAAYTAPARLALEADCDLAGLAQPEGDRGADLRLGDARQLVAAAELLGRQPDARE